MALSIPRSGSTRAGDKEYDPYLARILPRLEIRFNGFRVNDVAAYDCDRGLILTLRHRNKQVVLSERIFRGDVTVAWR